MNRETRIVSTRTFVTEYPYYYDRRTHFICHWVEPLLTRVFPSRGAAYAALNEFIKHVKKDFKQDYGNHIIPNIREEWFALKDIPFGEHDDE